jgi:hypothetical protein
VLPFASSFSLFVCYFYGLLYMFFQGVCFLFINLLVFQSCIFFDLLYIYFHFDKKKEKDTRVCFNWLRWLVLPFALFFS